MRKKGYLRVVLILSKIIFTWTVGELLKEDFVICWLYSKVSLFVRDLSEFQEMRAESNSISVLLLLICTLTIKEQAEALPAV